MPNTWKLKSTKQCQHCPWKKTSDPYDIPNGYSVEKHKKLRKTIADNIPVEEQLADMVNNKPLIIMTCHNYNDSHCIGWIHNQNGRGNNIRLRMQMELCENADQIQLDGEQHETFEDTIPKEK